MKTILISGSAGFIFSNFMRKVMREKLDYRFVSVDKVLVSNNYINILANQDHKFYMGDIADEIFMNNIFSLEKPDIVVHGAAQSNVDDSISSAGPFIHSNVVGTQVIVDMAVKHKIEKFIYVSSDEIYGQLTDNNSKSWTEESSINPRNPYSASKACGELIIKAAHHTHKLNYIITRCCNNFGPRQQPKNLIPKIITCSLNNLKIPIHGSGKQIREWIYVDDHCSAILKLIDSSVINETFNIGSGFELSNLDVVEKVCQKLNIKENIKFITDRKAHDYRYSLDCSKLKNIGWVPQFNFNDGLDKCIEWYKLHKDIYLT